MMCTHMSLSIRAPIQPSEYINRLTTLIGCPPVKSPHDTMQYGCTTQVYKSGRCSKQMFQYPAGSFNETHRGDSECVCSTTPYWPQRKTDASHLFRVKIRLHAYQIPPLVFEASAENVGQHSFTRTLAFACRLSL
jgi:hypothetical protein